MNVNPIALPTFFFAAIASWIGTEVERHIQRKSLRRAFLVVAVVNAIPGILFVLYYVHLFDNVAWFYNLRAIRYTELLASGMGLLAGFIYSLNAPESVGEKLVIPVGLLVLLAIPFLKPVITPLDVARLNDHCDGDACLQSTRSTCGPTSAANILKTLGQSASEKDLAIDAYTYRGGTENRYLSRALRRRGFETHVVVDKPIPQTLPTPSIAGVVLCGGAGHFIAVISQDGTKVTIVDPLIGKMELPREKLEHRYRFTGFFLIVRKPPSELRREIG